MVEHGEQLRRQFCRVPVVPSSLTAERDEKREGIYWHRQMHFMAELQAILDFTPTTQLNFYGALASAR